MASRIRTLIGLPLPGRRMERLVENDGLEMGDDASTSDAVANETIYLRPNKLHYLGMFLALTSSAVFSVVALFFKLARSVPTFEGVLVRFQLQLLYSFPLMIYRRDQFFYPRRTTTFLVIRGLIGGSALCCKFFAFKNMPLGDATALFLTSPVFTAILGFVCLKESMGKFDILAAVLSLVGILLIARPVFLFGGQSPSNTEVIAIVVALLSAILSSISVVLTRKIVSTVQSRVVVLYVAVIGSLVAVGAALVTGDSFKLPDCGTADNWYLLLLGMTGYLGQMLQTRALSLEKAAICSVIRTSGIFFTYILQILFLDDVLDAFSVSGAVLMVLCNVSIFVSRMLRTKKTS